MGEAYIHGMVPTEKDRKNEENNLQMGRELKLGKL